VTVNGASANLTIATGATLSTLISTNSFAGELRVNGTLNSTGAVSMFGGLISGAGVINAPSIDFLLGAVSPGTVGTIGTLTVNGNVNLGAGSTTIVDFNSTTTDLLKVNGAAVIGGTVMADALTAPQMNDAHVFLTATGGITGAYNAVPDTIAGVLFPVVTTVTVGTTQEEVLSFKAGTFVSQLGGGGTADQNTIAAALDASRAAHYNDLITLYQAIDPLSGAALGQALEDLAPDAERAAPLVGEMETTGFDNMIWQHLDDMTGQAGGGKQAGLHVDTDGLKMALSSATGTSAQSQQFQSLGAGIATNPGGGNDTPSTTTGIPAAPQDADDSWVMLPNGAGGFLSGSSLDGSVAIGGGGGKADVRGLVVGGGLDMPIQAVDGLTLGASLGYSDASATLRSAPATLQTDTIQGALYARYDWGNDYIAEAFASYGHHTMETRRIVVVGATAFDLMGHTGGDAPSLGAYFGRSFGIATLAGPTLTITPSLSLQYIGSNVDAFTETGGAPAMTFASFGESSGLSRLGFDAHMTFDIFNVNVTPNVHAFWVDNFDGNNGTIQSAFAAAPGAIMTFATAPRDRSYGELGLGADVDLGAVMGTEATLSGRYDATSGRQDISYGAWTGRLTIKF
jgi:subtilase-type serine protease